MKKNAVLLFSLFFTLPLIGSESSDDGLFDKISPEKLAIYSQTGNDENYKVLVNLWNSPIPANLLPAQKVKIPLRNYPNGQVMAVLTAELAFIGQDSMVIRAENVHVEKFTQDGTVEMTAYASKMILNRETMLCYLPSDIIFNHKLEKLSGNGAYLNLSNEAFYLKILSSAKLVSNRITVNVNVF